MGTEVTFQPRFGNYLLLKLIAKGGMAEVFRAMAIGPEGFSKLVAVKRILPHLSKDPQYVDMFINEARLAANLIHTNIVQILDFGNINNLLYQSMEYVHGRNLADIIQVLQNLGQPAPCLAACYIFDDALTGLDHAHRKTDGSGKPLNLIHRDMSPHNIMVSYEGGAKIVDFGIAKASQTTVNTAWGVIKGKQEYMSPEQVRGEKLDKRTDIFSMGICFYELLTLTPMYSGAGQMELLSKIGNAEFVKPRKINPNIPEALEAILLKALAVDPDQRYQTAADWIDALNLYLTENNLRFSSSRLLSDFMDHLFHDKIQAEQRAMVEEARLVESIRPGPDTLDEISQTLESGSAQIKTVVMQDLTIPAPEGQSQPQEPAEIDVAYQQSLDQQPYDDGESTDEIDGREIKNEIDNRVTADADLPAEQPQADA
ncbi:MAG: serine/threonine protein kinase, partial [Deltaproteobacteria bacterium]|nr:serine/threonine protein kinase [Deltaproteobacteria bacterium]